MLTRRLTTAALLTALLPLGAAPPRAWGAQELTPEEDREARSLAVRFVERLREADDFGTPAAEFLPADFAERLRRFLLEAPQGAEDSPPLPFYPALLRRLDAADLRRADGRLRILAVYPDIDGD